MECHDQMEANGWFMGRVLGMPYADGWMSWVVLREAHESCELNGESGHGRFGVLGCVLSRSKLGRLVVTGELNGGSEGLVT